MTVEDIHHNAVCNSTGSTILDFLLFLLSGVHLVPLTFPNFSANLQDELGAEGDEPKGAWFSLPLFFRFLMFRLEMEEFALSFGD